MDPSIIGAVIVLCAFLTFPLIAETLDPPDQHLNTAEPTAAFPSPITLWKEIEMDTYESMSNGTKQITISLPSPYCLQRQVKVFKGNKGNCDSMLWDTLSPVWRILGFNDTRTLLDHYEPIVDCPTWGSFLIVVMERAITDPRMNPDYLNVVMTYKDILSFVTAVIFLPLIAKYKNFHEQTLWLHCPSSGVYCTMKKSLFENMIERQANNMTNDTVFPIVNPVKWLLPVDNQSVITLFNATIYPELEEKLSYHNELFNKGHFIDYVDSIIPWFTQYGPGNGFFFMNILHLLEEKLRYEPNTELWKTVVNYKRAIENTALSYRLHMNFLKSLDTTEVVPTPTTNPSDRHLNTAEPMAAFPSPISLWKEIDMKRTLSNGTKRIELSLPSPYCLQWPVKVIKGKEGNCHSMLWDTLSPLFHILGFNDIQALLDDHKKIVNNHPTWGSFLITVMERAITDPRMIPNHQLIMKYKTALNFIMPRIFLPLIAKYKNFHQQTLWLHCKPSGASCTMKKSLFNEIITRQANQKKSVTVFPIVNPVQWLLPVDNQSIITLFNATIYPELEEKLSYHNELFNKGHFIDYLHSFATGAKPYPNSGFYFMHILVKLEKKLEFETNTTLWKTVVNYRRAIENTALSYHLPINFLKSLDTTKVIPATTTNIYESRETTTVVPATTTNIYENAPVFPKGLDPMKGMVVHSSMWPSSSCIELDTGKKNFTILDVTLPSIYCLQSPSSFTKLRSNCKKATKAWTTFMAEAFPAGYKNFVINNMKKPYPTLTSYLAALDGSFKSLTNKGNDTRLRAYRTALTLAVPYINLPLIAHYSKLDTEVVWLTFHLDTAFNTSMRSDRPENIDIKTIILPLVNPRLWHLPVDKENPYSVLLPDIPDNDPYAIVMKPLMNALQCPGKWFIDTFERNRTRLEHQTRGLFFMNLLIKLDQKIARGNKNNMELRKLALIVKSYRGAIQSLAHFNHIPPSYIAGK